MFIHLAMLGFVLLKEDNNTKYDPKFFPINCKRNVVLSLFLNKKSEIYENIMIKYQLQLFPELEDEQSIE